MDEKVEMIIEELKRLSEKKLRYVESLFDSYKKREIDFNKLNKEVERVWKETLDFLIILEKLK